MLDQTFINAGHLYKLPPQNINMHVYEHRQAVDMAGIEGPLFRLPPLYNIMIMTCAFYFHLKAIPFSGICCHLSKAFTVIAVWYANAAIC